MNTTPNTLVAFRSGNTAAISERAATCGTRRTLAERRRSNWAFNGHHAEKSVVKFTPARKNAAARKPAKRVRRSIISRGKKAAALVAQAVAGAIESARRERAEREAGAKIVRQFRAPAYGHKNWQAGLFNPPDAVADVTTLIPVPVVVTGQLTLL